MTRKKFIIFSFALFMLLSLFSALFFTSYNNEGVYAYSVEGRLTDTAGFSSSGESSSGYGQNEGGVQSENVLCSGQCISIKYDLKDKSTNNVSVYQEIKSISVRTNSLPDWWNGAHSQTEGTLYVEIYKDGELKETLSTRLWQNETQEIEMSHLTEKYQYYTFKIIYKYKIHWVWLWNNGDKYVTYKSNEFKVQYKPISGKLTKTVYDVNNECYTDTIEAGGVYKTDNKNMFFQWNRSFYDNDTTDECNVWGSVLNLDGSIISQDYEETNNGQAGYNLMYLPDGTYKLKLFTALGGEIYYTLIIEPFAQLLNIESGIRYDDVFCIEDSSVISWEPTEYAVKKIEINGHQIDNGTTISPGQYGLTWNVEYTITVTKTTDAVDTYKVVFTNSNVVDLNYNQNLLEKSPIARWYETSLDEDAETKEYNSWASYDNVLAFAIDREWATVTTAYYDGGTWTAGIGMDDPLNRKEGNYYIYKQRNNSSEKNAYFSKEALDSSILEYAKASISNNTYFSKSKPSTPHEGEEIYKKKINNGISYNLFLLDEFQLIKQPYVDIWINGVKQDFGARSTFTISTAGTYTIEEINPFGDKVMYYIYIQKVAPEVQYTLKNSSLTQTLTKENTRFGSYLDLTLFDIDDDSLLVIEKEGIGSVATVYTYYELLDILNSDKSNNNYLFNVSGEYNITAINHWTAFHRVPTNTYTFYVSVNEPFINDPSVNKEKNELTLSYGIPTGEYNVQITSVIIKKYLQATDTWIDLTEDSKGTPINTESTSFIFNTQGYYYIEITDNFGRTYSREYAFSREKPNATIVVGTNEVQLEEDEKGYYNKKVTITWYDTTTTAKMYGVSYTWVDGEMVKTNISAEDYLSGTTIYTEGYYLIELLDIDYNSRRFEFYIDMTAPTFDLISDSLSFESGGYKNTNVFISYSEPNELESPITISLTKDSFPIALPEDKTLTEEGTYEIIIKDASGNTSSKQFTIDKTAPSGQLFLENGSEFANNGITNKNVYCTWSEEGITATCNDKVYYKGAEITSDGVYKIVLTDKAGNTTTYNFQINSNIPIIVIKTESGKVITNNQTIDESFTISWEDPNYTYTINIRKNGEYIPFTNYTELSSRMFRFDESGTYKFSFTNGIGVSYDYYVNANMRPSAIITAGLETLNSYDYTNKEVLVTISDRNATIEVSKLDENQDYKTYTNWSLNGFTFNINEDGSYRITMTNDFDLTNNYYFTIKTSLPTATILSSDGSEFDLSQDFIGTVTIKYDENEVADCKLYRNGQVVYDDLSNISNVGRYVLMLTDKAGNQNSYSFTIVESQELNWAGLVVFIVLIVTVVAIAVFLIIKFRRPVKLK